MLAAKLQPRKHTETTSDIPADEINSDNQAIYPLVIPLLAGPSTIMSVIVVNPCFAGNIAGMMTVYAALIAVMVPTAIIFRMIVVAEGWLNEKITRVFPRITAIIFAGLSMQYVIDGMSIIRLITS
jgi:small neutral amino acid transporter SnatA (MarC family)